VLEAAERLDIVDVVADTLVTRGSALVSLGRRYEGLGAIETGQKLAASHSLHRTQHRALNNLSSFLIDTDPRAALEAAREGSAIARRLGDRSFQLMDNACAAAMRTGDWDWATGQLEPMLADEIDPLTRAVAISDLVVFRAARGQPTADLVADLEAMPGGGADTRVMQTTLAWSKAWIAFSAGRHDAARAEFHRFGEVFTQGLAEGSLLAAHCALFAHDADGAREDLDRAQSVGRRGPAIDADLRTIRAGITALEGRPAEALNLYRDALRTWHDLGLAWHEALCELDMATLLDPTAPEVRAVADSAREILTRLGAKPFVSRLDAAMERQPSSTTPEPARSRDPSTV
jgi:tetratricopeptide (TPR) repeat protein